MKNELNEYKRNCLFLLSDNQRERIEKFTNKHYEKCGNIKTHYILDSFTIEIKCPICGEIIDITEK